MDIYKKAGTVDAGGYGFLLILEGFSESLSKKSKYNDINKTGKQKYPMVPNQREF